MELGREGATDNTSRSCYTFCAGFCGLHKINC